MKTEHLILYRNMEYQKLLEDMDAALDTGGMSGNVWSLANQLIELAAKYGLEGNLWHCFLALCIADHENAYSISCEIRGQAGGSLETLTAFPVRSGGRRAVPWTPWPGRILPYLRSSSITISEPWEGRCGSFCPATGRLRRTAGCLTGGSGTGS